MRKLFVLIVLLLCSSPLMARPGPLVWSDEFGGSSLAPHWGHRRWWGADRFEGEDELQVYHRDAATVAGGRLSLTASRSDTVSTWNGRTYPYRSGLVSTGGVDDESPPGFTFLYGTVEARIRLPKGQGIWPAFWMLTGPVNGSYDDSRGEIDVVELIGSEPEDVEMHLHHQGSSFGRSWDSNVDQSLAFHTYAVDWQPGRIRWLVDGVERYAYTGSHVPDVPMYLLLNVAVGGDWPGPPDHTTQFPATMEVDYVRVYSVPEPATAALAYVGLSLIGRRPSRRQRC